MFKCKYCNQEFETKQKLGGHTSHCKLNPNYKRNKINCNNVISIRGKALITSECPYCKENITSTKSGVTFHINRCKENPNRKIHPGNCGHTIGHKAWNKGLTAKDDIRIEQGVKTRKENYKNGLWQINYHKWTPEEKETLSIKRKQYLSSHPEEHTWKRNNKFISKPCEYLKNEFRKNNINFIEEYSPFTDYNYSIDIAWPNLKIGIEVNGNQHYNNDGQLNEYYQKRHNIFKERGWRLYEIHYTKCYKLNVNEFINNNNLDTLDEEYVKNYFLRKEEKKNNLNMIKQRKKIEKEKIQQQRKEILIKLEKESNIDFSKYGWVNLAKQYIENIDKTFPTKMLHRSILKYYPEFFKNKIYIRSYNK